MAQRGLRLRQTTQARLPGPPRPRRRSYPEGPGAPASGPAIRLTAPGTLQPGPEQPRPAPPPSHLCLVPGSSSSPRCASYQGHLVPPCDCATLRAEPRFGSNSGVEPHSGGMLGSGALWISIFAYRPRVELRFGEAGTGQLVTLSLLTLPQSRDQAAGRLAHVVRREGRGLQAALGFEGGIKPRLGEGAPANPGREGRSFGHGLKKLVAGPRTETELQLRRSGGWSPATKTKIGSCVATSDSSVSVHSVTGRDPCVHPH